jgi:hypothetical protein
MTENLQPSSDPQKENVSEPLENKKDTKAKFAIASLVIGLSSLPIFILGFIMFLFVAFISTGALPFIVLLITPLISFAGVVLGVAGLGSKRWVLATIGIVLSSLFLLYEGWMAVVMISDNWDRLFDPIKFGN